MARVDEMITDAVTQSNVKVVGEAPAMALGTVYQSMAQATGMMYANSVNAQGHQNTTAQAAATQGVMKIYSSDAISDAAKIAKMVEDAKAG